MARCTKEKALETRERILDAAEDVFDDNGVSNTSLADIATAAGVTRGAIYWHFTNKRSQSLTELLHEDPQLQLGVGLNFTHTRQELSIQVRSIRCDVPAHSFADGNRDRSHRRCRHQ